MSDSQRTADIETLARMAARHAGREPDEHFKLKMAHVVVFDDLMWRYPDFLARAEAAYDVLTQVGLTRPASFDRHEVPPVCQADRDRPDAGIGRPAAAAKTCRGRVA